MRVFKKWEYVDTPSALDVAKCVLLSFLLFTLLTLLFNFKTLCLYYSRLCRMWIEN